MGFLAFVSLMILAGFIVGASWSAYAGRRRAEQASLLWMLSISLDRGLPLAEEVRALAEGFRRKRRIELTDLAEQLEQGKRLDFALANVPQLVSPDALLTIQAGAEIGILPEAVRQAAFRDRQSGRLRTPLFESFEGWFVYVLGVLGVVMSIVTFLMVSIIPKFKKIFDDFGTRLPQVTELAIAGADFVANYGIPLLGLFLLAMAFVLWQTFLSSRGWKKFEPPLFGKWVRRFDAPGVLRACAMQVDARRPLPEMLEILSRWLLRPGASRAMHVAWEKTAEGGDCWAALVQAGFLTSGDAAVLTAAERAGNLSWAMRTLADAKERRWSVRFVSLRELMRPVVVLPIGLLVFLLVTAFFMPLVKLINDFS